MTSSSDKSRYDSFHGKTENELKEEAKWHHDKQIKEIQERQEQEKSKEDDYDIDERNS